MNAPRTHTICIVGAAADVAARLAMLLDEQRTRLDSRWRTTDYAGAELLLVEADSVYGHMDWLKAQGSGRLVAALTATPDAYEFPLRTPIIPADLIELLNRVSTRLAGSPVAAAPAATAPAAAAPAAPARPAAEPVAKVAPAAKPAPIVPPVILTPKAPTPPPTRPAAPAAVAPPAVAPAAAHSMRLVDLLGENPPMYGRLHLQANGLPDLFLDTHDQTWHSTAGLKALMPWCTRALSHVDVQMVGEADYSRLTHSFPSQPSARLKWLVHLIRNDGQLDPGLDPKAHYKLSRWPQSEREFPKHFRIATVMLKQASTLDEIATQGGATAADVANFINAYNALGYIESDEGTRAQADSRGGGLFGRAKKTSAMS